MAKKKQVRYGRKGKRSKGRAIRQNRPNWRKKVLGRKGAKIKSKEWERV